MVALALALALLQAPVQAPRVEQLAPGKLLVASRSLRDADFAHTVILLVHYDNHAAVGLMLNRPSKIRIHEVFPKIRGRLDPVYAGGPVPLGVNTLVRARTQPGGATPLLQGVYLIADKSSQRKVVAVGAPSTVRVYVGYCGWSTQQLKDEIAAGHWQVVGANAALLFDADPASLWPRLNTR